MNVQQDIAGPRFSWSLEYSEDRNEEVTMYAGEWFRTVEEMGEDFCWHEEQREKLTIGKAIDLVGANEAATAQLAYAPAMPALKASLTRALGKRGLRLA